MKIYEILNENDLDTSHEAPEENQKLDDGIYLIPEENWGALQYKIERLQKRAVKLGVPPVSLEILGKEEKRFKKHEYGPTLVQSYIKVRVYGETPKMPGWKLLGVLDHEFSSDANVVHAVPGQEVPPQYRHSNGVCDHCKKKRPRSETFVLQNDDGTIMQIGRQCIKDFLGHQDPKMILAMATYLRNIDDAFQHDDDSWGGFSQGKYQISMDRFLAYVAAEVRENGWISKAIANQREEPSTTSKALSRMYPTDRNGRAIAPIPPEEQDVEVAKKAREWARNIEKPKGDYEYNLSVIASADSISYREAGIAGSMIQAYFRYVEQEFKKKDFLKKAAASEFIGTKEDLSDKATGQKGKRIEMDVQYKGAQSFDSAYGTSYLVRFVTTDGNHVTWWASVSPGDFIQTKWYKIKATLNKHTIYKDIKQTEVKRVQKVAEIPEPGETTN